MEDRKARFEELTKELEELKERLPEHCSGTQGYVGVHRASPELLQKIEELEIEIERSRASTGP